MVVEDVVSGYFSVSLTDAVAFSECIRFRAFIVRLVSSFSMVVAIFVDVFSNVVLVFPGRPIPNHNMLSLAETYHVATKNIRTHYSKLDVPTNTGSHRNCEFVCSQPKVLLKWRRLRSYSFRGRAPLFCSFPRMQKWTGLFPHISFDIVCGSTNNLNLRVCIFRGTAIFLF